jgi:hypothetical protein
MNCREGKRKSSGLKAPGIPCWGWGGWRSGRACSCCTHLSRRLLGAPSPAAAPPSQRGPPPGRGDKEPGGRSARQAAGGPKTPGPWAARAGFGAYLALGGRPPDRGRGRPWGPHAPAPGPASAPSLSADPASLGPGAEEGEGAGPPRPGPAPSSRLHAPLPLCPPGRGDPGHQPLQRPLRPSPADGPSRPSRGLPGSRCPPPTQGQRAAARATRRPLPPPPTPWSPHPPPVLAPWFAVSSARAPRPRCTPGALHERALPPGARAGMHPPLPLPFRTSAAAAAAAPAAAAIAACAGGRAGARPPRVTWTRREGEKTP